VLVQHWAILIILCLLGALFCACPVDPPLRDNPDKPDVRWTKDWKFVTVYLDGAHLTNPGPIPPGGQRAMTEDTARMGFDYFEAVFYCDGDTMRTAWEIGMRASVYGVYRDSAGVDYSRTSVPHTGIVGAAGQGAILFAGRKKDKSLLAVGKVYSVDDVQGTVITSESSYVTFELFMLTAAVSYDPKLSSFTTGYHTGQEVGADNTYILEADIGGRFFPLYNLPQGKSVVKAEYKFELDGADWEEFAGGMLVAEVYDDSVGSVETGKAFIRNPRYPAGSGHYWYPEYPMDVTTNVRMTNNQTHSQIAENTVKFEFDTSRSTGADIGLFTLVFRIPVIPLLPREEPGFISPSPEEGETTWESGEITWFIRPAYQSYFYNIDNGVDSTGGGILMGFFGTHTKTKDFSRRWDG